MNVGDVVFHKDWDLCLFEIIKFEKRDEPAPEIHRMARKQYVVATIQLVGGIALPADWAPTKRFPLGDLRPAEERFSEMEIIAMASADCHP